MSDLAERWLEALRSGEYNQGIGKLYKEESHSFCCLGVLCNISDKGTFVNDGVDFILETGEESAVYIPISLIEEVGLTEKDVIMLVRANDLGRLSFSNIANRIETMREKNGQ